MFALCRLCRAAVSLSQLDSVVHLGGRRDCTALVVQRTSVEVEKGLTAGFPHRS
jgi:hypothetical protein